MIVLDDLSDFCRKMNFCVYDRATEAEKKKKQHNYERLLVYPAFPWKFDKDLDRSAEDPGVFFRACEDNGMIRHIRKIDERAEGLTMTYEQWLAKHKDEPGFVNHMEAGTGGMINGTE